MTAPHPQKTIRVSEEVHRAVHDLAQKIGGSADDALGHLLGESTVRVPLSDAQRRRWTLAAREVGVSVDQFVKLRVESALQFGSDPNVLELIYKDVQHLRALAGRRIPPTD